MVSFFVFNSGKDAEDAEDDLGAPSDEEAKDHPLHVRRCGFRFLLLRRTQRSQGADIRQIKWLVYLIIASLILTSSPSARMFSNMASFFKVGAP